MSEYILELRNISKSFSGVEVLHHVSFALRPGEVHALLGENGAGKSTLIKVITGVHQPDAGEILLYDKPVRFGDTRDTRQAGITAIYQELSLFPDLNVAENIFVGCQPVTVGGRIDWRKLYSKAEELLTSLGVHLDLRQKARSLSIAQQPCALAISANDSDALVPTGKEAMEAGIPVVTWDSAIGKDGRNIHINQAVTQGIAAIQIKVASDLAGPDGGQIAVLSATSTAPNQNAWIEVMKEELTKPEYANLELVEVVYGDDDDTKSYNEAQALFTKYPDLKVIIAPTTVGIAASARAVTDAGLIGKVFVTGLGTPNQMREYVKNGAAPQFALWNPGDLGYLAVYAMHALATGEITGAAGDTFTAGRLGEYTIEDDPDLGLNVLLGEPFVWNIDNIDDSNW